MAAIKLIILCSFLVITIMTAKYIHTLLNRKMETPPLVEDAWWGLGERPENVDTSISSIRIQVPDVTLVDLKNRLKSTRFQTDLEEGDFHYGFQATYMKEIVQHWLNKYDWRKHEAVLNSFNHFKTNIEGISVHFMRVKPVDTNRRAIPLLLLHGWPGSVWEFHKIIPQLVDIQNDIVFEVICPSLPGYGFSEAPRKKGFDLSDAARVFVKLMGRLGFEQFYLQGGDMGSLINTIISAAYPQHVLGFHTNFVMPTSGPKPIIKLLVATIFPSLVYEPDEIDIATPLERIWNIFLEETGYNHIQSTKPDTVGMGLTDSPVGLAAYILEKFSHIDNQDYRDCKLTSKFTLDELITNLMIYWTNQNVVSTLRYYKEMYSNDCMPWLTAEVSVPTGLARFPDEAIFSVKSLAADQFTNIVQFSIMPRGGHFAAFEQPDLLANDLRAFVRKVEEMRNEES